MKTEKIKVLVKRVGQPATVEEIENKLDAFQKIVGGYIEITSNRELPKGVQLVCHEEGKLEALPSNIYWGDTDVVVGDILFMSHNDEGEAVSLTEKQIEGTKKFVDENDAAHYAGDPEELAFANLRVATFGSDEAFYAVIAGDVFEEPANPNPPAEKNKKDMEM